MAMGMISTIQLHFFFFEIKTSSQTLSEIQLRSLRHFNTKPINSYVNEKNFSCQGSVRASLLSEFLAGDE